MPVFFEAANSTWYVLKSNGSAVAGSQFGISNSDTLAPGDYDGNGKADIAVFRNDTWYIQRSTAGFAGVTFGISTDTPVPNAFVR